MGAVNIGPLSFSPMLLIGILALLMTLLVAWLIDRRLKTKTESLIWKIGFVALFAGRTVFVIDYFELYVQRPLSVVDLRDGGFSFTAALIAAFVTVAGCVWRQPVSRKPLFASLAAGLSLFGMAYAALQLVSPQKPVVADVMMTSLQGQAVPLSQFRGQPAVINLWASWCPPCRREMPALQAGQHANPDIHFVFANQGEAAAIVDAYLDQESLSLDNVLLDTQGNLADGINSRGLPTTLFLDEQGRLVDIRLGELSSATLEDRLNALRSTASLTRSRKD